MMKAKIVFHHVKIILSKVLSRMRKKVIADLIRLITVPKNLKLPDLKLSKRRSQRKARVQDAKEELLRRKATEKKYRNVNLSITSYKEMSVSNTKNI
jgi:hypothetical protein